MLNALKRQMDNVLEVGQMFSIGKSCAGGNDLNERKLRMWHDVKGSMQRKNKDRDTKIRYI